MADADVIVVAYNSEATLNRCLASLEGEAVGRVIVVDNASSDRSAAVAREAGCELVSMTENRGFGAGCNAGARVATGAYLFFLNPDAAVAPGTIAGLVAELERHPQVALVASSLDSESGRPEFNRRRFPTWWRAPLEPGLAARVDEAHYRRRSPSGGRVDWVGGAAFLARRTAFGSVDGFDEGFFLYSEEVDLAYRLRQAGWEVRWVAGLPTRHSSGASSAQLAGSGKVAWVEGFLRFAEMHARHPRVWRLGLWAGMTGRSIYWTVRRQRGPALVWRQAALAARPW